MYCSADAVVEELRRVKKMRRPRKLLAWLAWLAASLLLLSATRPFLSARWPRLLFARERETRNGNSAREQSQQRQEVGGPAYAAGVYMAGRKPDNVSGCLWSYELPQELSYHPGKVMLTPGAGERGPYRVLPSAVRPAKQSKKPLPPLTLCTHATTDRVYSVVELARRWEGPISLAVFTPGLDAGLAVALLDRACRCEPAMAKVSVHFVFPAGRPPALGPRLQSYQDGGDCAASDLQGREAETERGRKNMMYPINVARNVARSLANTSRVLVSDIELLPSEGLASGFYQMVRGRAPRPGVVFVVPVFEVESYEKPPDTKNELLEALAAGVAVYFHRFVCPHCQRFPGLTRWILRPDPGRVEPLIVTRREVPHHRWEPVFVGTRDDPLYTVGMSWEGRQDKMAQMFEMCLLQYRLVILDGAFLVHAPGIKRKQAVDFDGPHERRNSKIYRNVIQHLLKRYRTVRKCGH